MGNQPSKPVIDGLGHPTPLDTPPLAESRVKLDQLLLALSANYQFNSLGELLVNQYFMGATPAALIQIFDTEAEKLAKWAQDDPEADSVCESNVLEFANQAQFQERYYDFFRDQLTEAPEWEPVVRHFEQLVFDGLWQYDMRALIHLGCASEINHPVMAMEALGMGAWATPESSPQIGQDADFRTVLERALEKGGTAARGAAAVCQLVLGPLQLPKQQLVNRLAHEIEQASPGNADWTRARYVLKACLRSL